MEVHRGGLRVAGRLGILFDELTTTLGVTRREGGVADDVERRLVFHAATGGDMGRGRREALEARSEEGRHNEVEEKKRPVQDGEVDGDFLDGMKSPKSARLKRRFPQGVDKEPGAQHGARKTMVRTVYTSTTP
jgi:hypothetical protein